MRQILTAHGFLYCGKCSCDGKVTEKYKKGLYQLRYRIKQQRFRIKHEGSWLMQWTPITELENKLNELEVLAA